MNDYFTAPLVRGTYPTEVLQAVFDATPFEHLRLYLWQFLKAAVGEDYFRFRDQPAIVCGLTEQLGEIIELFSNSHHSTNPGLNPAGQHWGSLSTESRNNLPDLPGIDEQFKGKIRRLTKAEIEDLHLVTGQFFAYCSREQWLAELKQWQYYALVRGSLCTDTDDTTLLEKYELLEKLLEAAYLLHARGSMVGEYQWTKLIWAQQGSRARFLSQPELDDPYGYLYDYFRGTTLAEHTRELANWITAAFSTRIWDHGDPARLIYFFDETMKLTEMALLLHIHKLSGFPIHQGNPPRPLQHVCPRFLSDAETENPYLVLAVLSKNSLQYYEEQLKCWLYHALSQAPVGEPDDHLDTYHLHQKLAEALYLMMVKTNAL